ncbi:MAG: hypothetical protein NC340_04255 [Ruminococcus flavefaciens]|nr:hypothetical protein [Ruminococcus flavefaciens]MCM1229265.1 hypothetical protein [Ruminococcus flavefaciens]
MKKFRMLVLTAVIVTVSALFVGCKDYCTYGGCMEEATKGDRCPAHYGLENDPYYGVPRSWLD